jgi:hypothetical protein
MVAGPALAQTTVYRWVDSEGRVHFTDQPPSEAHRDLTQRRIGGTVSGADTRPAPSANLAAVVQRFPVVLYTSAECGEPCRVAREMLLKRGIPFSERSVQSGPEVADELIKRAGGLYVPAMGVGPNTLRGFEESAWRTVLDTAGYSGAGAPAAPGPGSQTGGSAPPAR